MDTPPPRFRWFIGACIVFALMGIAHCIATLNDKYIPPGDDWATLDRLWKSLVVPEVGRTMNELFHGFSWFFTLAPSVMAAASISLLPIARREPAIVRRLAVVYGAGAAIFLANSLVHWFIAPTSFLVLSTLLFFVSAFRDGRPRAA